MRTPAVPFALPCLEPLHANFLVVLPRIELHGRIYFRYLHGQNREDAIAEMVALAWKWYLRLAEQGKDAADFPSTLASYAVRAVASGRRLCGMERAQDALSPLAQRRHGFAVDRLHDYSTLWSSPYAEALADNARTPPDEAAAFRIDWPAWLVTRTDRDRRLMADLARGERPLDASRRYGLSPGRVSQLRRAFHDDWERFCGCPDGSANAGR